MLLALLATGLLSDPALRYDGRARQLDVKIPRADVTITVDGALTEPVWEQAARLTGFSRYAPTDNVPADDSTEVLVWYSPTAIHFGVRAFAQAGTVHATLADRDKMYSDDYIGIFLGTFNDGRQATVFAANPLGVQGDGVMVESGRTTTGFSGTSVGREPPDINPDFVFESKGRVTETGYEIEIRIPFKSLRYQQAKVQDWGFNILRKVQSRGYEYSWAPALRAASSYLGQVGRLTGLTGMHRGVVLDVTPVATSRLDGAPAATGYDYDERGLWHPRFGANVRWGVTTNLTLNGTVRPDFAEVESDAGQLVADPRQALQFAEKRPFFLESSEQFTVPGNLIYTRKILAPLGAVKLTGKMAGLNVGYLGAVDDTLGSFDQSHHPIYNILRVQRDVGKSSRAGFVFTDKEDGPASNRVLGGDTRVVLSPRWSVTVNGAVGRTARPGSPVLTAPRWAGTLVRSGRSFGARYSITGIHPDFRTAAGIISRPNVVDAAATHTLAVYGESGSRIERASLDVLVNGTWAYRNFPDREILEKKLHFNGNIDLHGGWHIGASVLFESFGYDPTLFTGYAIERHTGATVDTIPFTGTPKLRNLDWVFTLNAPQFRHWSFNILYLWGRDENFFEWSSANIGLLDVDAQWRPTDRIRMDASYIWQFYHRRTDGTTVGQGRIPRVKVEYQLGRSMFLRVVGQYAASEQDNLRDDSRTNDPLLVPGPGGILVKAVAEKSNVFQPEWLFSYLPTPGTVIYVGYGSTMTEAEPFRFGGLHREHDSYFVKLSYLFRK